MNEVIKNFDYDSLTMEELNSINKMIRDARKRKGKGFVMKVARGDRVVIKTGRRSNRGKVPMQMSGVVTDIYRTRVGVDCGKHGNWRVPGSCLVSITHSSAG